MKLQDIRQECVGYQDMAAAAHWLSVCAMDGELECAASFQQEAANHSAHAQLLLSMMMVERYYRRDDVISDEAQAREDELMRMPASEVRALLDDEDAAACSRGHEAWQAGRPSVARRLANGLTSLAGHNLGYVVLSLMLGIMGILGLFGLVHVLRIIRP